MLLNHLLMVNNDRFGQGILIIAWAWIMVGVVVLFFEIIYLTLYLYIQGDDAYGLITVI